VPVDKEWALLNRAKADAAADRKHQELLDRIRASVKASRAIVQRLQQKERAPPEGGPRSSTLAGRFLITATARD
jgi:hypothetical protein